MFTLELKTNKQSNWIKNSMYEQDDFHTIFNSKEFNKVSPSVPIKKISNELLGFNIFSNNEIENSISYTRLFID